MSGLINKVKEAVHSDKKDNHATDNPKSSNAGPHGSNAMNTADPRVDSDRDNIHSGVGGHTGHSATGAGLGSTGTHGNTGAGLGSTGTHGGAGYGAGHTGGAGIDNNPRSTNAGPHGSNMMNSADPRVDSDRDGSRNMGAAQHGGAGYGAGGAGIGSGIGSTGTHGTTGAGYGAGHTGGAGIGNDPRSTNAGPHGSNMMNSADPRVDSDRDGSHNMGAAQHGGAGYGAGGAGIGSTGAHSATTGAGYGAGHTGGAGIGSTGTHGTSGGLGGSHSTTAGGVGHNTHGTTGGISATPGSGNTNKTAGPHNSDMMNKLDPRVDSDMDGSKTYGGNQTHH